jgi:type I restriction enzyme R subunit
MEQHGVYQQYHVDTLVGLFLANAERDKLDPILDACAAIYKDLDEDAQVEFKGSAKGFVRTYGFLGAILPYASPEWEKLSIFLNLLLPKLPSPKEDDQTQGILDAIDLDSYATEAKAQISIQLEDSDAEVDPVPTGGTGSKPQRSWICSPAF